MEWCGKLYVGGNPGKYVRRFTEFFVIVLLLCMMLRAVAGSDHMVPPVSMSEPEAEQTKLYETAVLDTGTAEAFKAAYKTIVLGRYSAKAESICSVLSGLAEEAAADIRYTLPVAEPDNYMENPVSAAEAEKMITGDTAAGNEKLENSTAAIPEVIMEEIPDTSDSLQGETNDTAAEIPEISGNIPAAPVPSPPAGSYAGTVVKGFLVNEAGAICGIAEPETVVEDGRLILPSEGCTAIASDAFLSAPEGIREVYIPANITHIEEGAFAGLYQLEWFNMESSENYMSADGVLFSEGGTCLLAFPAARIGIYRVPSEVVRFASDAFDGASVSKLDARGCLLEDVGNIPEEIEILQRL